MPQIISKNISELNDKYTTMTNKSIRDYINLIENAQREVFQFLPIDKFPRTDDENQPELYLKTKDGNVYVGEWDPASGYFFATDIVRGNHPTGNELPGRMYNQPVAFAVKQDSEEHLEETTPDAVAKVEQLFRHK